MGRALLKSFKKVHKAGYVYNDLKLDNIVVEYGACLDPSLDNVLKDIDQHLIDYGLATAYLHSDGSHISSSRVAEFKGNAQFASIQ